MKRLLSFVLAFLLLPVFALSEPSLHTLWDLDISSKSSDVIRSYLYDEKGIVTWVRPNYDGMGHFSIGSQDDQDLSISGFPFKLHFTQLRHYNVLSLRFSAIESENDVFRLLSVFSDKYGLPSLCYCDLYSRTEYEWEHNIGDPMYHETMIIPDVFGFPISDTLNNWEYLNPDRFFWGAIVSVLYIDNIKISIEYHYAGKYDFSVTFYSVMPSVEIPHETVEARNVPSYTDTGL